MSEKSNRLLGFGIMIFIIGVIDLGIFSSMVKAEELNYIQMGGFLFFSALLVVLGAFMLSELLKTREEAA